MKLKQLLIIPTLLVAVMCMATKCKGEPKPDVDYQIYMTNNSASSIQCKSTNADKTIETEQQEYITRVIFSLKTPKNPL